MCSDPITVLSANSPRAFSSVPPDEDASIMKLHAEPGRVKGRRGASLLYNFPVECTIVTSRRYTTASRKEAIIIAAKALNSALALVALSIKYLCYKQA
ncbi:hypothetical protein TNCV_1865721 [Trichonephila clavipes]|nr:hypothetical protein TNCV_1865721 [Trichonephila clavipes]